MSLLQSVRARKARYSSDEVVSCEVDRLMSQGIYAEHSATCRSICTPQHPGGLSKCGSVRMNVATTECIDEVEGVQLSWQGVRLKTLWLM